MTYGLFLLLFLVLPTLVLAGFLRRSFRRHHGIALGLVCLLAFVYTTPWDNYAAYKNLWSFGKDFVWGPPFWFGYLPLEEYLFYFAEAIFVAVVWVTLSKIPALRADHRADLPESER
ncbi:MAG: lycopene cyclase domain-containing protein [Capsulimonadales bacterium]|nr:lycopene cyclase domain-containing protein [Capsulimonadales bacterium]